MGIVYDDIDLRGILLRNSTTPVFDPLYPNGDRGQIVAPAGLTLLKRTDFSAAELGQTTALPEIVQYSSDTAKRAIVVDNAGYRVLRFNVNTQDSGPDPISGQTREGNLTHYFNAGAFYSKETTPDIVYRVRQRIDDSWWAAAPDGPVWDYPVIDGKYFLEDKTVGQLACYLGLKNFTSSRSIRFVAGNHTSGIWSSTASSWTYRTEGGLRRNGALGANGIDLVCDSGYIFRSTGQFLDLVIEIRYNPGGLSYHKMRIRSSTGAIYRDLTHGNTDADGYFPIPNEYEFKGCRPYSNGEAYTSSRQDFTNAPGTYTGYCGGWEIGLYELYSGGITVWPFN